MGIASTNVESVGTGCHSHSNAKGTSSRWPYAEAARRRSGAKVHPAPLPRRAL